MMWTRRWTRMWTRINSQRSRILTKDTVATDPARVHVSEEMEPHAHNTLARVHLTVSTVSLVRNRVNREFSRVHLRGGCRVHLSGRIF